MRTAASCLNRGEMMRTAILIAGVLAVAGVASAQIQFQARTGAVCPAGWATNDITGRGNLPISAGIASSSVAVGPCRSPTPARLAPRARTLNVYVAPISKSSIHDATVFGHPIFPRHVVGRVCGIPHLIGLGPGRAACRALRTVSVEGSYGPRFHVLALINEVLSPCETKSPSAALRPLSCTPARLDSTPGPLPTSKKPQLRKSEGRPGRKLTRSDSASSKLKPPCGSTGRARQQSRRARFGPAPKPAPAR